MDAFELNEMMVIVILVCIGIVLSKLALQAERLKRIETLLLSYPGIDKSLLDVSPEVKDMIKNGHKYKAMVLHRKQTESTARNAELAVEEFIAQQRIAPKSS
ncbi:MAG TPA: hypothetical protein VF800_20755 [Telluria sp.]|jgi:LmbE family N-acetylglucosaminyl deacetylase